MSVPVHEEQPNETVREKPTREVAVLGTVSRRQRHVIAVLEVIVAIGGHPIGGQRMAGIGIPRTVAFALYVLTLPFAWLLVVARNWHKP